MSRFIRAIKDFWNQPVRHLAEKRPMLFVLGGGFVWVVFLAAALVVVSPPLATVGVAVAGNPNVCTSCHEIQPFFEKWQLSSHKGVRCTDCHTQPGLEGYVKVNLGGIANTIKHFSGDYQMPLEAQVKDESCLSCHPREKLPETIPQGTLRIAHTKHSDQTCADCHGRLVHNLDVQTATVIPTEIRLASHTSQGKKDCLVCHPSPKPTQLHGDPNVACDSCHSSTIPRHNLAQQSGIMARDSCLECHNKSKIGSPEQCQTCHVSPHGIDLSCNKCHTSTKSWTERSFTHPVQLVGEHSNLQCVKCHTSGKDFTGLKYTCSSCHQPKHEPFKTTNDCATCHTPQGWKPPNVNHKVLWTGYEGLHAVTPCESCHPNAKYKGTSFKCADCHKAPPSMVSTDCTSCHKKPGVSWKLS